MLTRRKSLTGGLIAPKPSCFKRTSFRRPLTTRYRIRSLPNEVGRTEEGRLGIRRSEKRPQRISAFNSCPLFKNASCPNGFDAALVPHHAYSRQRHTVVFPPEHPQ